MMKPNKLLMLFCFFSITTIYAQISLDDLSLVESFQSEKSQTKPAIISFTAPRKKESSFLINAAFGIDISGMFYKGEKDEKLITITPFIEYNRNTLIDKEQHQLQSGISMQWISEFYKFNPVSIVDVKYVNDYIEDIESLQGSIIFTPNFTGVSPNSKNILYPNNLVNFGKKKNLAFEYIPYFGIENEKRIKVKDETNKGYKLRFVSKLESNIYLFRVGKGDKLFYRIVFNLDYQYRKEIVNSTLEEMKYPIFFKASINYTIFKSENIDIKTGLDYVKGADPSKSFQKQEFYNLSLKVKI